MKKLLILLFFISTFLYSKTFRDIEFTGDVDLIVGEFDRTTLLKVCHIDYPPIYKIWKPNPTFESSQIKLFKESLEKYAQSMGYYRAKISATTQYNRIILKIQKNQPIKIASILLAKEFERLSSLKEGKRFRTVDFSDTKKSIVDFLEQHGYPAYTMDAKAYVDLDKYRVEVNISVEKGGKRYFSSTEINNSSQIDNELIEEQIVYKKGELYNVLKVDESYENIYELGVFEEINMEAELNNSKGEAPIFITLKEGKTKEFASNLGYDTEDGARAGMEYIDHNFFGNLREFKAWFHLSERGYDTGTSVYDPRIELPLIGRLSFLNELSASKWDYDSYVEKLFAERVTFKKSLIGLEHYFGFKMEHSTIETGIPTFLAGNYLINSLFYRVEVDKRDSPMDAKNGYLTSLYVEKAMKQIGSEIDYLKVMGEVRYIKEFKPMVFAGKVKAGTISEPTPPFKHFFLGGAMSNRGYEYRDLGEHLGGYPIGGVSMIDASFESRYYLTDLFSVVGFFDTSKLSQEVNDFSGEWYNAYGIGVRYLSIIGPLRLDIGYPLEGAFAVHLGIGQVF